VVVPGREGQEVMADEDTKNMSVRKERAIMER
jgi:hypothetical protein